MSKRDDPQSAARTRAHTPRAGTMRAAVTRVVAVTRVLAAALVIGLGAPTMAHGQDRAAPSTPPADYVIGPDDVLEVNYWKDRDASAQVVVRPDGCISLPLLNDVPAAGLTPAALTEQIRARAAAFMIDPTVTVIVRQINSRKVYIVGEVDKPGAYVLGGAMTVLQLVGLAGGPTEYAHVKDMAIVRQTEAGTRTFRFNYQDALKLKRLGDNILLRPGDTVIVR